MPQGNRGGSLEKFTHLLGNCEIGAVYSGYKNVIWAGRAYTFVGML